MLPGLFSLLGLAGTSAALFTRWLSPALMVLSVASLARSFYGLYVQQRGTRTAELITWGTLTGRAALTASSMFHREETGGTCHQGS